MQLHLFGASSPTGEAVKQQHCSTHTADRLISYSRRDPLLYWADFSDPDSFTPGGDSSAHSIWISFAPIWLLAPFLDHLSSRHPERLKGLRGVIACSSSSVITKRFSFNRFDRELVARLISAEDLLFSTCQRLALPCRILRPTLIYGRAGSYLDRNLSRLISLMRCVPVLPLPSHTGLRQPIHAAQLAAVVLAFVRQFSSTGWDTQLSRRIAVGGDSELTYASMLYALQQNLPDSDRARRCLLIPIPTRLFQFAAAPLLLHSPKTFEAVLRISADLSGFTPAHQLLGAQQQNFPVLPLL